MSLEINQRIKQILQPWTKGKECGRGDNFTMIARKNKFVGGKKIFASEIHQSLQGNEISLWFLVTNAELWKRISTCGEWSYMLSFGTTPYTPGEEQVHNSSDIDEILLSSRRKFSKYSNEPNLLPTKIGCQPVSKILFLGLPICPQLVSRFQTPDKLSVHQSYWSSVAMSLTVTAHVSPPEDKHNRGALCLSRQDKPGEMNKLIVRVLINHKAPLSGI